MPELRIDVTPFLKVEAAFERFASGNIPATKNALREVGTAVFSDWKTRAANTPGVYRKPDYLDGLDAETSVRDAQGGEVGVDVVHTRPEVARAVHQGVPSHDMKPYLTGTLKGSPRPSDGAPGNARLIVKDGRVVGRINFIPYRQKVGGMGRGMARAARGIAPTRASAGGGATQWGGRLTERQIEAISTRPEAKRAYQAMLKSRQARGGKEPSFKDFKKRFAGMVRMEHRYGKATQSTYRTFRAVSVRFDGQGGSPPDSWIHPGWGGVNFPVEAVKARASEIKQKILAGLAEDLRGV